jgi:hypothetical protein
MAATHFFNASLEMLAAVPTADGTGLYLMSLYRRASTRRPACWRES